MGLMSGFTCCPAPGLDVADNKPDRPGGVVLQSHTSLLAG